MTARERFQRATRDYYAGRLTPSEYHAIAAETDCELEAMVEALRRHAPRERPGITPMTLLAAVVIGALAVALVIAMAVYPIVTGV